VSDPSAKLVILDRGNGYIRHQLIRKKYPMDFCFKLNEQFSYYHPLLKEVVKVSRFSIKMTPKSLQLRSKKALFYMQLKIKQKNVSLFTNTSSSEK
jgi:hypothetical protein